MSEHLQSNILLLSLQYFQTFILLNYQIDVSTMLFLPPWLNPQTNMFSGWMPSATSLSIMACTFSTALRTPVSSCGELYSFEIEVRSKFQCRVGLLRYWRHGVNSPALMGSSWTTNHDGMTKPSAKGKKRTLLVPADVDSKQFLRTGVKAPMHRSKSTYTQNLRYGGFCT